MTKFVADNELAIEVTALRWIQKVDRDYSLSGKGLVFMIEWEYRSAKGSHLYTIKAERDAMFDKICEAMKPRRPEPPAP